MALANFEQRRMQMTEQEYLAFDRASEIKHEFYNGLVVAMSGGSLAHDRLAGAMYFLVREQLGVRGPCQVYTSNVRVFLHQKESSGRQYVYPDVTLTCDIVDHQNTDIIRAARLVVEVLSPSTEKIDQNQKLNWYKAVPSMYEYVIVHTRFQRVEIHRREENGWAYYSYSPGDHIRLDSVDIHFPLDDLYAGLQIPV